MALDDADLERTLLREMIAFAAGRGPNGADLLVRFPGVPPKRPEKSEDNERDPLAHLEVSILRPRPFVPGPVATWAVWTRLMQVSIVIRADLGDLPALALVEPLRQHFPQGRRITGAAHDYAITEQLVVGPSGDIPGWRILPTTIEIQVSA